MTLDTATIVGIIGTIVGIVVGVLVTVIVHRLQSAPKYLDYEFISGVRLIASQAARLSGDLKIQYQNQPVKDPYLLLVRLINTGNKHIDVRDFDHPVRIELGDAVRIVAAEIVKTSNQEMRSELETTDTSVLVHPLLFNQQEWMALSILIDGEPTQRRVITRISGGAKPREFKPSPRPQLHHELASVAPPIAIMIVGAVLVSLLAFLLFPGFDPSTPSGQLPEAQNRYFVISMLIVFALAILSYVTVNRRIAAAHKRRIKDLEVS